MNKEINNFYKGVITSLCIIISFFLGYYFCLTQTSLNNTKKDGDDLRVEIETKSNKIDIQSFHPDIKIFIDGEAIQTESTNN